MLTWRLTSIPAEAGIQLGDLQEQLRHPPVPHPGPHLPGGRDPVREPDTGECNISHGVTNAKGGDATGCELGFCGDVANQLSHQVSSQVDKRGNSASKVKSRSQKNQDGDTVQIVTKDLIRSLRSADKHSLVHCRDCLWACTCQFQ